MEESEYKRTKAVLDTANKKDTPDFTHILDVRNQCISLLMTNLVQYQPFIERMNQLKLKYEKCDEIKGRSLTSIESLSQCNIGLQAFQTIIKQTQEYLNDISTIVSDYGLNPDWARELIHEGINDFYALITGLDDITIYEESKFNITWDTAQFPSKKEAIETVMKQFNEQWHNYENTLKNAGFFRTRKRGSLNIHVLWTYKKVCLHKTWNELAKDEGFFTADSLRKPVYRVIKLLGLKSQEHRGGRPRN
jgi:hypothetical protein